MCNILLEIQTWSSSQIHYIPSAAWQVWQARRKSRAVDSIILVQPKRSNPCIAELTRNALGACTTHMLLTFLHFILFVSTYISQFYYNQSQKRLEFVAASPFTYRFLSLYYILFLYIKEAQVVWTSLQKNLLDQATLVGVIIYQLIKGLNVDWSEFLV